MAFRTEGLWADWGRQVGERPMPAEHGAAAGPGAGEKAALGFTVYPLTSGWPGGSRNPSPGMFTASEKPHWKGPRAIGAQRPGVTVDCSKATRLA